MKLHFTGDKVPKFAINGPNHLQRMDRRETTKPGFTVRPFANYNTSDKAVVGFPSKCRFPDKVKSFPEKVKLEMAPTLVGAICYTPKW